MQKNSNKNKATKMQGKAQKNKSIFCDYLKKNPSEYDRMYQKCMNLRYICRSTQYSSDETSEDAFSDTLLRFISDNGFYSYKYNLDNNSSLADNDQFMKYFSTAFMNRTKDIQRTEKRHKDTIDKSSRSKSSEKNLIEYRNPATISEYMDTYRKAHAILDNLDPRLRDSMKLFIDGSSYQEIADQTNTIVPTVTSRLVSAKKQLRENWHKQEVA